MQLSNALWIPRGASPAQHKLIGARFLHTLTHIDAHTLMRAYTRTYTPSPSPPLPFFVSIPKLLRFVATTAARPSRLRVRLSLEMGFCFVFGSTAFSPFRGKTCNPIRGTLCPQSTVWLISKCNFPQYFRNAASCKGRMVSSWHVSSHPGRLNSEIPGPGGSAAEKPGRFSRS